MTIAQQMAVSTVALAVIGTVAIQNGAEQFNPWLIGFGGTCCFLSGFLMGALDD